MSTTRGSNGAGRVEPRKEPRAFKGLCSTCIYASECANAARAVVPVVHCEEFDDRVASPLEATESPFMVVLRSKKDSRDEKSVDSELKGLCVNCDNRKICLRLKPVGGVWYCEEYR